MAKSFSEYLRDAEALGLTGPAASAPPKDIFGDLSKVSQGVEDTSFTPLSPLKWAVDILSRPEYAVTGAIMGIDRAQQDQRTGKSEGTIFDYLGSTLQGAAEGFTSTDPDKQYTGAEVLEHAGVDNDLHRGITGFALDVALDPLTYLTGGLVKLAGAGIGHAKTAFGGAKAAEEAAVGGSKLAEAALTEQRVQDSFDDKVQRLLDEQPAPRSDEMLDLNVPAPRPSVGDEIPDVVAPGNAIDDLAQTLPEQAPFKAVWVDANNQLQSVPVATEKAARDALRQAGVSVSRGGQITKPMVGQIVREGGDDMKAFAPGLSQLDETIPIPEQQLTDLGQAGRESIQQSIREAPVNEVPPAMTRGEGLDFLRSVMRDMRADPGTAGMRDFLSELQTTKTQGLRARTTDNTELPALFGQWQRTNLNTRIPSPIPGNPARTLRDWLQRKTNPEFAADANRAVMAAFRESPEGKRAFEGHAAGEVRTGEGFADYATTMRNMNIGLRALEDTFPPNVYTLLEKHFTERPEHFEKLMNDLVAAYSGGASGRWFETANLELQRRLMLGVGLPGPQRTRTIQTAARLARMGWETAEAGRLASTSAVWMKWAKAHLKKKNTHVHARPSGAKSTSPVHAQGVAYYEDEINIFGQYDRAKFVNETYFRPGAPKEKEWLDFVEMHRKDRIVENPRLRGGGRPGGAGKVYGEERARLMLDFRVQKYRELDEIDDAYGFRSQLRIGPGGSAMALASIDDVVPLSIGDIYGILRDSSVGTPLEHAMYRTLQNYQTAVSPTALMLGVLARVKGDPAEVALAAFQSTKKFGARGQLKTDEKVLPNNLVSGRGTGMQHYPARKGVVERLERSLKPGETIVPSAGGKGYYIKHSPEQLLAELSAVVEQALPLLKAKAADNAIAFTERSKQEIGFLTEANLKGLDDIVANGTDGDLLDSIVSRRADMHAQAERRATFQSSTAAALTAQEGLISIGGKDLIPTANRLNLVRVELEKRLYPAVVNYQRGGNSFGLTAKHGGQRRASEFVPPTNAELKSAVKHAVDAGDAEALRIWEKIAAVSPSRLPKYVRAKFTPQAIRIRDEKAALEQVRAAIPKHGLPTKTDQRLVAASQKREAEAVDRVTQQQQIREAEDTLAAFQTENQAMKENLSQQIAVLERELDAGGDAAVAAARAVDDEVSDFMDLASRASGITVETTTGRLLDPFRKLFVQNYGMETLHPRLFKNLQLAQQYVAMKKRKLMDAAKLAGVSVNASVVGSKLPLAFSNLQRGTVANDEIGEISRVFEDVLKDIFPTGGADAMSSVVFRNAQDVDLINDMLARNGLKGRDIGLPDGTPFDWERATRVAGERGTRPMDEVMEQWREWDVKDPMNTLSKVVQTSADIAHRRAMLADFRSMATQSGLASTTPKPGYVRVTATGDSSYGGFLDMLKGPEGEQLYFPREMAAELQKADEFVRAPKQAQSKLMREYYLPALNAWKWSITLPRPGHHIRNMIGDWSITSVARGVRYFAQSQQDALKVLGTHTKYDGVDIIAALERRPNDPLPRGGDTLIESSKYGDFTIDELFGALNDQGLRPSYHAGEGLFDDEITRGTFARVVEKATIIKGTRLGEQIGKFSEYRDHYARAGHFMQALRQEVARGKYSSRQELLDAVGKEVRKYHPDATMLTPFEGRVMRNIIPFYSWFRGVLPAIFESSMRHPNRVMLFPKASYNLAVSQGIDPESFANPFPDDQLFPSFLTKQVLGPQFILGDSYVGLNPGIAHLDVFNTLGGGEPEGLARGVLGMISPIIRVPAELAGNSRWSTGQPIRDTSDYLDSSIPGVNYLANMTGFSPTGSIAGTLMGRGLDQQEQVTRGVKDEFDQGISLFNWLSGLSAQNMSKENYQTVAEIEARDRALEEYKRTQNGG